VTELEQTAQEILKDRKTIVDLDRIRNGNREALRYLMKKTDGQKSWFLTDSNFLQKDTDTIRLKLEKEQKELDSKINGLRNGMKKKMDIIRDLENKPALKGFNLQPLDSDQVKEIYQTIGK